MAHKFMENQLSTRIETIKLACLVGKCSNKNIFILINLENDEYCLNNSSLLHV